MEKGLIFLYPGQGSQETGMGLDLYVAHPRVRELFEEADRFLGYPLSRYCLRGPDELLNQDLNAQLGVYLLSCAVTDLLSENEVLPAAVSGYSSGFYAAAYAAGCFGFLQGLEIVGIAGEVLLEETGGIDGAMAVVFGLSVAEVERICRDVGDVDVSIVNTPRQIIVSGLKPSVERVMEVAMYDRALDTYLLPAAVPYHSRFVAGCTDRLLKKMTAMRMHPPRVPLYSYSLLRPVDDQDALKKAIALQLSRPVLWEELIRKLQGNGGPFIEVGPGRMLGRTIRWIDRKTEVWQTGTKEGLFNTIEMNKPGRRRSLVSAKACPAATAAPCLAESRGSVRTGDPRPCRPLNMTSR
jgi:[acyl-carrier-protein] S-malonyltransferase